MKKFLKKVTYGIMLIMAIICYTIDLIGDIVTLIIGLIFGASASLCRWLFLLILTAVRILNKEEAVHNMEYTYRDYIKSRIKIFKDMRSENSYNRS